MDSRIASPDSEATSEKRPWMPIWLRALWLIGIALIVFLGGIVVGMLVERNSWDDLVVLGEEWSDFGAVVSHLESDDYYRPQAPDQIDQWQEVAEAGAINGLLDASGDAYAQYLPANEAAASSARLTGAYEGIGVSIGEGNEEEVEIVSVLLDSPASRADVRVGDIVAEVDATPIPTGDVDLAAELLRGDAGTDVAVTLERTGEETVRLDLTREVVETGERTVEYLYVPKAEIAVITITLFATTTVDEIDAALALAQKDGATQLVLDLRGNPGGWVSAAQGVIGRFVPESAGPALLEDTRHADGEMLILPIRNGEHAVYDGELLVLIDLYTASAAEIVAGALQDYDRATVVGMHSFGKGSVQRVYEFPGGESLRLTVAEWFSPEGRRIQDQGIDPDIALTVDIPIEELPPDLERVFMGGEPTNVATPSASPVPDQSATPHS
ncbi:MAG: S41 family peptidase [Thermomicrobiales bacterium]